MVGFSSNLLTPSAGSSWSTKPTTRHSECPKSHLAAYFVAFLYTGTSLRWCLEASFLLLSQCEVAQLLLLQGCVCSLAWGLSPRCGVSLSPKALRWGAAGWVEWPQWHAVCVPCRGELPHRHGHDWHRAGLQQPQQRRGSHGCHHEPAGGRRGAGRPRGLQRPALAPVNHPETAKCIYRWSSAACETPGTERLLCGNFIKAVSERNSSYHV